MLGAVYISQDTLAPLIAEMSNKYNIEEALIKAVIQQESNWDTNAKRYEAHLNDTSWGLMQLLLSTAKWILGNEKLTLSDLANPRVNIEAGTKYLRYLWDRYGNLKDAVAAYNAGSPRLTADKKHYVNQDYVDKVYGRYLATRTLPSFMPDGDQTATLAIVGIAAVGLVLATR